MSQKCANFEKNMSIKASELRLGNFVYEGRNTVKVAPVHIVDQSVSDLRGDNHLLPIPLTEEILLKCGFDDLGQFGFGIGGFHVESTANFRGTFNYSYCYRVISREIAPIKHLHQLQNLYFALTGEELKIDLG